MNLPYTYHIKKTDKCVHASFFKSDNLSPNVYFLCGYGISLVVIWININTCINQQCTWCPVIVIVISKQGVFHLFFTEGNISKGTPYINEMDSTTANHVVTVRSSIWYIS